ncbi:hypothetical protein C4K46_00315 [Streptococcus oricebi]|uniref:Uncharacterized protein n=1 Tax=Streptococcus oricebi TaxID=1547447 RepID=A0ABS5B0M4_9STRE|nr:hypothetical protein [Streptococcus oricebi]
MKRLGEDFTNHCHFLSKSKDGQAFLVRLSPLSCLKGKSKIGLVFSREKICLTPDGWAGWGDLFS